MAIIWNGDVSQTAGLLEVSGQRELRWFGITVGQIGFGVLISMKRQPAPRAADGAYCGECKSETINDEYGWCGVCGSRRR